MKNILPIENIFLNLPVMQKEEAIYTAAEVLRKGGYVTEAYYEAMLLKEKECETYIGNGVAIPHGISHSEQEILHSGIAVLQFRTPIDYHGNAVHLVKMCIRDRYSTVSFMITDFTYMYAKVQSS